MRQLLLAIPLLLFLQSTYSQSFKGHIKEQSTGNAIEGATISILNTSFGAISDEEGTFSFSTVPDGKFRIRVSHISYKSALTEVSSGQSSVEITLQASTFQLNEDIVISTQRTEQDRFNRPEAISIYDQRQLLQYNPRSSAESLIGTAGVWMQKTNHGGGSPFIRGLTGNQTLLLIDGIRLNNATYRYGPNQYFNTIDPLSMERIEVIRGSGSVQYGSDALGGVAHVITRDPRFSSGGTELRGQAFLKYMNEDMEMTGRAEIELGTENFAFLGGISGKDFGALHAGGDLGDLDPSSYREIDVDAKAIIRTGSQSTLKLAYQRVGQQDVNRYDQVAQRGYQLWRFDPQNRDLAYARFETDINQGILQKIRLTTSYHKSTEGRIRRRQNDDIIRRERDEVDTYGAIAEFQLNFLPNWSSVSGVEYYFDEVASSQSFENITDGITTSARGLYPDGSTASNIAIFSLHDITLGRLYLSAGVRFNAVEIKSEDETFGDLSLSTSALVGHASALYTVAQGLKLAASVNTGFRAPNINDISSFGSFDFGIEVPSNDLASERTLTGELGIKVRNDKFSGSVFGYYTRLFDLIARERATFNGSDTYQGEDVYKKTNIDEAYITGFEAEGEYQLTSKLSAYASIIYTYGGTEDDDPLRRIPPLNGRLGLHFQQSSNFWAKADFLYASKQDRLSGGDINDHRIPDGGTPGWEIFNVYTGYNLDWLQLGIGLQNIFDQAYRIHGSGVDGYGRSLWLSARFTLQ